MIDLKKLHDAILNGNVKSAVALTKQAIAENCDPAEIINGTMIPAMGEVGRLFEEEEYFVPEMLLSARAMKGALEQLRPLMANSGIEPKGPWSSAPWRATSTTSARTWWFRCWRAPVLKSSTWG